MKKVFISWSRETEPVAAAVARWITDANSETEGWISNSDIIAGQPWRTAIDAALRESACAIACLGPSSIKSAWLLYELGAIGSVKRVIPMTLLIPTNKLPSTLTDLHILNIFPSPRPTPSRDVPDRLARALGDAVGMDLSTRPPGIDATLLAALEDFAKERLKLIRSRLTATRRSDMLIEMLRYVKSNPVSSPRSVSEDRGLSHLFGKKSLTALALFWLHQNELLDVSDFDNIKSGQVSLSYDGELLLSNLEASGA